PVRTDAGRGRHAPALRPVRGAGRGVGGSAGGSQRRALGRRQSRRLARVLGGAGGAPGRRTSRLAPADDADGRARRRLGGQGPDRVRHGPQAGRPHSYRPAPRGALGGAERPLREGDRGDAAGGLTAAQRERETHMVEAELARFIDRWTMEYVRFYPHPVERLWRAITDPAELAQWFIPPTKWELKVGGAYRMHDDGFAGVVLAVEPPTRLRLGNAAADGGYIEYQLSEAPGGARMRFVNHFAPGGPYRELGDLGGDLPA